MKAKVVKSPLGKLPFSEYLRQTAPALKELIALEEQREKQAATIYKKYIQYRMQQGDKRSCMDFREFCDFRFDLDNVDVPVAYEEDEEKRRHR